MRKGNTISKFLLMIILATGVFYSGIAAACDGLAGSVTTDGGCTDYGISQVARALGIIPNWRSLCITHDRCYYKIGKPKKDCDVEFRNNLRYSCKARYGKLRKLIPNYYECLGIADSYYGSVRTSSIAGDGYLSSQRTAITKAESNAAQNCETVVPTADTGLFPANQTDKYADPANRRAQIQALSTFADGTSLSSQEISTAYTRFFTEANGVPENITCVDDFDNGGFVSSILILPKYLVATTCGDPNFQYEYLRHINAPVTGFFILPVQPIYDPILLF